MFRSLRLITFDVTNTLISVSKDIGSEYAKVASIYGVPGSDDPERILQLSKHFKQNFRKLNQELPNFGYQPNGKVTSVDWWSRLVVQTFEDSGFPVKEEVERRRVQNAAAHLYKLYSRGSQWKMADGAYDVLFELRKTRPDISLGIVSNFDERLESILRDLGVVHFFKHLFISRLLGTAKPDPKLWEDHVFLKGLIENPAKEYLHIGDSVELDYLPVRELGGNALIIGKDGAEKLEDPKHLIHNLKDILPLIST